MLNNINDDARIRELEKEVYTLRELLRKSDEGRKELIDEIKLALQCSHESALSTIRSEHQEMIKKINAQHDREIHMLHQNIDQLRNELDDAREQGRIEAQQMAQQITSTAAQGGGKNASEFAELFDRFKGTLITNYIPQFDLEKFYSTNFAKNYRKILSARQMAVLLSRDERSEIKVQAVAPSTFFEEVCSRLPMLEVCDMNEYTQEFNTALLAQVVNPFPKLKVFMARMTLFQDDDLLRLIEHAPQLELCDVTACIFVTWEGLQRARELAQEIERNIRFIPETEDAHLHAIQRISSVEELLDERSTIHKLLAVKLKSEFGDVLGFAGVVDDPEERLTAFWVHIGGYEHWADNISILHLHILLNDYRAFELKFRVGNQNDVDVAAKPIVVAELKSFTNHLLSRLGRLRTLTFVDCPIWPFDVEILADVDNHFCTIRKITVLSTPYTRRDVVELCRRLDDFTLTVDWNRLAEHANMSPDDREALIQQCGGKLQFRLA